MYASDTGHADDVPPIATSRGQFEVPSKGNKLLGVLRTRIKLTEK